MDLITWQKAAQVAGADTRWYEVLADQGWHDQAFRDPWAFLTPTGTAGTCSSQREAHRPMGERGVVGHCWSPDLRTWEVCEPLNAPGQSFGQLGVMHSVDIDGHAFLVFRCLASDTSLTRLANGALGGTGAAPAESPTGPYDIADAQLHELLPSPDGLHRRVGRVWLGCST